MALSKKLQEKVERATVKLVPIGGQGLLVNGNLIITAAHCVMYSLNGEMSMGGYYIQEIETWEEQKFKLAVLAVEPVSDIAILGPSDIPELYDKPEFHDVPKKYDDVNLFQSYWEKTEPILLSQRDYEQFEEFPVYIYNQDEGWITGVAEQPGESDPFFFFDADKHIQGGTSGGPIVNEAGELEGIASFALGETPEEKSGGKAPQIDKTLPIWLWEIIREELD